MFATKILACTMVFVNYVVIKTLRVSARLVITENAVSKKSMHVLVILVKTMEHAKLWIRRTCLEAFSK